MQRVGAKSGTVNDKTRPVPHGHLLPPLLDQLGAAGVADEAITLYVAVGSHAVLEVIEKYQPMLGLHGHIHEGKGTRKYNKTLCINPGSMYEQGRLLGAVVNLARNKIKSYVLTTG